MRSQSPREFENNNHLNQQSQEVIEEQQRRRIEKIHNIQRRNEMLKNGSVGHGLTTAYNSVIANTNNNSGTSID
jgi:primosomal protein N'